MIRSFKNKTTQDFYQGKRVKKWQAFQKQTERRLQILDEATCLDELKNLPSNHFEALRGGRKGEFSIRINLQWRIFFKWINDEPHDVEIVDYH
ncbi:MAG: type II toxin-antitoxin system RelE/ParE family toxin [Gammaproteobacteria bacterium]|nr:type II toxin-antitoxin system RelE/ParE family toxin [Gammaproteobacteria bacterium]